MSRIEAFKAAAAATIGALTGLWGNMGWMVIVWVGCMALDYTTGSAAAAKNGEWSSARAREGIWHKAGMIVVVIVAMIADIVIPLGLEKLLGVHLPFELDGLVCPTVLVWYCITEMGSITENAVVMGAPVPKWLSKFLKVSKETLDGAVDQVVKEDEDNGNEI